MKWIKAMLTVAAVVLAADAYGAPVCNLGVTPMNFGGYNIFSNAPNEAEGFITITCDTVNVPFTVSLDAGVHSGGVFNPRKMKQTTGAATLNYNLYLNASATQIWGDGTNGSTTYTGTLSSTSGTMTVHGSIPPRQNALVGFYSDSVIITVLW